MVGHRQPGIHPRGRHAREPGVLEHGGDGAVVPAADDRVEVVQIRVACSAAAS